MEHIEWSEVIKVKYETMFSLLYTTKCTKLLDTLGYLNDQSTYASSRTLNNLGESCLLLDILVIKYIWFSTTLKQLL